MSSPGSAVFWEAGLPVDGWRIHRRMGMSGGLSTCAVGPRELVRASSVAEAEALQHRHGEVFAQLMPDRRPLSGAVELLQYLRTSGVLFGIATSGNRPEIDASLDAVGDRP